METSCTWWDLAPGRGVLELDEPEVDLELEIIGGWWASVTIPS